MTLYICLDDRGGMCFGGRRQSRDAALLADLADGLPGLLTIDPFSEKLIASAGIPYVLAEENIPEDAHFFLENRSPEHLLPQAESIVIYRWNRHYPSDVRWEPDLAGMGFSLREITEFAGTSHEKITREVYER